MFRPSIEFILERHTNEVMERSTENAETLAEFANIELTERELQIFHIGYGNGYSDSTQDREEGNGNIEVLK